MTETIEVEYENRTVEVPTKFESENLSVHFGAVPESWDVDRVFLYEGTLRTEATVDGEWVETVLHTDETHPTFNAKNDRGWIAEVTAEATGDEAEIGETVWERE